MSFRLMRCFVLVLSLTTLTAHGSQYAKRERPAQPARGTAPERSAPIGAKGAASDDVVLALQVALDRSGFSPGVIDGAFGGKTRIAIEAFQRFAGLPATGSPDAATVERLRVADRPALQTYEVTAWDLSQIKPPPHRWEEKAKASLLGYSSALEMLAERGHCSQALVRRLNPGMRFERLAPGARVMLPNVNEPAEVRRATFIEIDLARKIVFALDARGNVVGLFHCSIAKDKAKRPRGQANVVTVNRNPEYLFDPAMWPEVKDVKRKLLIPAGPNNPVGLCWIGLSLRGYGMHGTPEPELIGKTGSHGCFRLANWDAIRLGKMVRVGTPVRFSQQSDRLAASR
ncbi:MAG: murein L,D-transpeptidase [Planctomycetia bacterium]|nr:MAG: murein L,D-transpeptidase [Planctomycetia bacterium]